MHVCSNSVPVKLFLKRAPLHTNRKGGQKLIEDVEEIKRCYMAASLLGVQMAVSSLCPPGVGSVCLCPDRLFSQGHQ